MNYRELVTDINLKGRMNGGEVAKQAREIDPTFPIVYTTGAAANDWPSHGVPNSVLLVLTLSAVLRPQTGGFFNGQPPGDSLDRRARYSMPIYCSFDDAQIFVQCFHRGASIDTARRSLLKLLSEPRAEILQCFTVFQAQIAIHNQLQCFSHNEIRRSKYPPAEWADGYIVPRFCG
jgi:hypothetical protein